MEVEIYTLSWPKNAFGEEGGWLSGLRENFPTKLDEGELGERDLYFYVQHN